MGSGFRSGGTVVRLYRIGLAIAVIAFGGYYALTAFGDLIPLEHFGAAFTTTPQASVVTAVESDSPAGRAGLRAGDHILTVDGRPVRNALDWAAAFTRIDAGQPMPVVVLRDGRPQELAAVFQRRARRLWEDSELLFIVLARFAQLVTLLFATAIGARANGWRAVLGFWLLATISIYSVGLPPRMAVWWRAFPPAIQPLLFIPSISKVVIGFIVFTFFCTLLKVKLGLRRLLVVGAPFVLFATWDVMFLVALLYVPALIPRLTGFLPPIIIVNFGYLLAAMLMLGRHYRTLADPSDRRRLRWIVVGSVLGCAAGAPTVAGLWLGVGDDPTLIYHSPISLQLVYMAFLVMPVSFWWAIARGELFDLRFVVRRGLQYVFARRGLIVITPLAVGVLVLEAALHDREPVRDIIEAHAWVYAGTAALLVVFRTFRSSWLAALDRRLFRERYDAVQLLREVVAQIRSAGDVRTAASRAATQIDAALHPEWLAIYGCEADENALTVMAGDGRTPAWPRRTQLMDELRMHPRPLDVTLRSGAWLFHHLPADEIVFLNRAGVRLVVPALLDAKGAEVIFALGGKRSGEPYSREDQNLVHAIAESLGHLAFSVAQDRDEASGGPESAWDQRVWTLADAVARGSRVDWTKESTEVIADERRQVILELQALERLMRVHGAPSDAPDEAGASSLARWGDFELREPIGAGRFGTVYRAWDPKLERDVAIKLLDVAGVDRAAYLREARHLARVRHPNVVHVYGAGELDDIAGFWMELVEGKTLSVELRERGPFSAEDLSATISVLGRALAAVHRAGLVHQDVKAQNIMREHDGRLVLMDLGAGSGIGSGGRPQSGTPRYMAPELFDGGTASVQSDLYSLGVLLFLLATGEFPIDGSSYQEMADQHRQQHGRSLRGLRPDLPASFLDAVDRGLRVDPRERFASVDEFSASFLAEVS